MHNTTIEKLWLSTSRDIKRGIKKRAVGVSNQPKIRIETLVNLTNKYLAAYIDINWIILIKCWRNASFVAKALVLNVIDLKKIPFAD